MTTERALTVMDGQDEPNRALATRPAMALGEVIPREKIELVKRTICKGASDDELDLFVQVCNRHRLDPFAKQIYAIKRWDVSQGREVMATQVAIDGYRLLAERTGLYEGQTEPQWCGADGAWRDVWLSNEPPAAARVGVYRRGWKHPVYGIATYKAFCQKKKDGNPTSMWRDMADNQLAKCAEAQALRKAFPEELSGLDLEAAGQEQIEMKVLQDVAEVFNDFDGETGQPQPEPEPPADPPHAVLVDGKIVSSDQLPTVFEAHSQHIREATTPEALRKVASEIKLDLTLTPEQREQLREEWANQKHVVENGE